ncbi:glycosyltransferase family 2 protein [Yonghaparkia sp. Soil809]|uniref:glycosyltransferase n=1 Tax=Yonghaparkia sp. Soil809 TaxID=1736417 RepID=UPI000AFEFC67|nr:glycosyltransferase family 2 protein [Yonghaparkia sp. Soil809]
MSPENDLTPETSARRHLLLRILVLLTLTSGLVYISWRWTASLNFDAWWIAIPLVVAETYSIIDVALFGMTMWRARRRPAPPAAPDGATVDVFITTYNEDVELVSATAAAARRISFPHRTWILDDGARPEMAKAAEALGVGYITRTPDWKNKPLHAKAGNVNNALMQTDGEFLLILDADQIPRPEILDRTLGYFDDPRVALVQTPQRFSNVASGDPLGSQAPLFYGPIQQGKDGWNAAFFCGSNAVLRRDALMQLGVTRYVVELEQALVRALRGARSVIRRARRHPAAAHPGVSEALDEVQAALRDARQALAAGQAFGRVTYDLQSRVGEISSRLVESDLRLIRSDLDALRELPMESDETVDTVSDIDLTIDRLTAQQLSPLGAIESVQRLIRSIDVDRHDEAQPLMPLATISVTEDMATSMRLHALGWSSAYHHETLADGLAPDDLGTMLKQRLRWAQGTVQVMLRDNPLVKRGLSLAQRLMYFSTMWSYLSGFAAVVYFTAPVVFLLFGILPVDTTAAEFFLRFLPFMVLNQLMFLVASRGVSTWRGQQYSLALFPVWIRAVVSAAGNVLAGRPLDFVVTAKSRQSTSGGWRLVRWQLVVAVVLIVAAVVGIVRLALGVGEWIGTAVNLAWVVFDLVILSVLIPALRYDGYDGDGAEAPEDAADARDLRAPVGDERGEAHGAE